MIGHMILQVLQESQLATPLPPPNVLPRLSIYQEKSRYPMILLLQAIDD